VDFLPLIVRAHIGSVLLAMYASRIEWNRESGLINRTCTLHFIDPRYIYYGDRYLLLAVVSTGA